MKKLTLLLASAYLFAISLFAGCNKAGVDLPVHFDGNLAYEHAARQLEFGPRIPGSPGHERFRSWAAEELEAYGWDVTIQEFPYNGDQAYNIIASRELKTSEKPHRILIGAHYDTREFSDQDPDRSLREKPVPGANDGASGVAVLMELARVLPIYEDLEVQLVLFDAEDGGRINGGDWIVGSTFFAQRMDQKPDAVIIVDMIGDSDQAIYLEKNSDPFLAAEIWETAEGIGVESFFFEEKFSMLDDHSPFIALGIPSVLIIDFDYPYWHTTADTLDKISSESLQNVGDVLMEWLDRVGEAHGSQGAESNLYPGVTYAVVLGRNRPSS